jgi:heat shock protein HslJ
MAGMRSAAGAILLLLAGCASTPGGLRADGGSWRVVDLNGLPVVEGRAPTLALADGRLTGNTGCNSFGGRYDLSRQEGIRFTDIAVTEMACEPPVMEQERRFLAILNAVQGYSRYGDGSLSLVAADGSALRLRPR